MDQLDVARLIEIAAKLSVARMLERDDFEKRLAEQQPLFLHELLYPLIQGYDSVALQRRRRTRRHRSEIQHAGRARAAARL